MKSGIALTFAALFSPGHLYPPPQWAPLQAALQLVSSTCPSLEVQVRPQPPAALGLALPEEVEASPEVVI
jgi:hypothetical protein